MGRRTPDPDKIAIILADADRFGDKVACKRHKVSRSTLHNYRQRRAADPVIGNKCTSAKIDLVNLWRQEARAAQRVLLERTVELAKKSENVRDVAGALKIVSDVLLADQVVSPDVGQPIHGAGVADEGGAPPTDQGGAGAAELLQ